SALFRQYQVVCCVGALRQLPFPTCRQFVQRIFANRFEHQESQIPCRLVNLLDQALIHDRSHPIEQVKFKVVFRVAHSFHCFQSTPANENRKPSEKLLLGSVQKVVTPVHCATKSLLPCRQVPRTAGQELQATRQPRPYSGGRQ